MNNVRVFDPEIYNAISSEEKRQLSGLEMIASENYVSKAVMEAQGSCLTNKYAEGYPNSRYYGGCEFVDVVESLAIERVKELFGAKFANVQPHSGSQANMAAYMALIKNGDTIMGMDLSHGGHLTHGSKVNFSGMFFNVVSYGVDQNTGLIDYDELMKKARECSPNMIIAGFSAYPRKLSFEKFREIADKVGAKLLVDMAHFAGLVAGRVCDSPVGIADVITSTTHKTLRGPRGGFILSNDESYAKKINSKVFPGIQGGPLEHVIAAKAVSFKEALEPSFKDYAAKVISNAQHLADKLLSYGFNLVSGGTDNHLILVDLCNKNITGKLAQSALDKVGITVNKNTVPGETRSPFVTSGIRLGTAALTTRGMGACEMKAIAGLISRVVDNISDDLELDKIKQEVLQITQNFELFKA